MTDRPAYYGIELTAFGSHWDTCHWYATAWRAPFPGFGPTAAASVVGALDEEDGRFRVFELEFRADAEYARALNLLDGSERPGFVYRAGDMTLRFPDRRSALLEGVRFLAEKYGDGIAIEVDGRVMSAGEWARPEGAGHTETEEQS